MNILIASLTAVHTEKSVTAYMICVVQSVSVNRVGQHWLMSNDSTGGIKWAVQGVLAL